jgi:predicted TIM-barrel fold metal-dependent hydrolase
MSTAVRCDSHVHIVGSLERYPQLPSRPYIAGLAPLEDLRSLAARCGIARFVIVQPSFYGTENTLLLESLGDLGEQGRGVVVIDPARALPDTLADHAAKGVRGLRINLYGALGSQERHLDRAFAAIVNIARDLDWHIEVIAPIAILVQHFETLLRSPVPVVIDHYGVYGHAPPESAEGVRLLALLRQEHVWMKLSAPYRVSANPLETRPNEAWLAAVLAVAADRCVWGSDWPHTPPPDAQKKGSEILAEYRPLSYERLVDDFYAALPSQELAERIMSDNPARLYGFSNR